MTLISIYKYIKSTCRACFKENSSLHISIAKAGLQILDDRFTQKFYLSCQISERPFCHCTNSISPLHISIHHYTFVPECLTACTLKQTLSIMSSLIRRFFITRRQSSLFVN